MTLPILAEERPQLEEYLALRRASGLGERSVEAARRGLGNELYALTARVDGTLVGMGRVVGDGGCFAQLVDIAVRPDRQGQGLGRRITTRLVHWCYEQLPATCYVSLIANAPATDLYRSLGFEARPMGAPGMGLKISRSEPSLWGASASGTSGEPQTRT